jgi:hypothetical protein
MSRVKCRVSSGKGRRWENDFKIGILILKGKHLQETNYKKCSFTPKPPKLVSIECFVQFFKPIYL